MMSFKRRRQAGLLAIIVLVTIGAFACGQNPNITRDHQSQVQSSGGPLTSADVPSASAPGKDLLAGPAGAKGEKGDKGDRGDKGETGATGAQGAQGIQGVQGIQGAKGEKGEMGCEPVRRVLPGIVARNVTEDELKAQGLILPYTHSKQHPLRLIPVGHVDRKRISERTVADSQVVFAFDLKDLPSRESVDPSDMRLALRLDVTKVRHGDPARTEILCLLNQRVCSGSLFITPSWEKNINPDFFSKIGAPINPYFSAEVNNNLVESLDGQQLFQSHMTIELDQLLKKDERPLADLATILYGSAQADQPVKSRTLYVEVADDIYVDNAELVVEYTEDECTSIRDRLKAAMQKAPPASPPASPMDESLIDPNAMILN